MTDDTAVDDSAEAGSSGQSGDDSPDDDSSSESSGAGSDEEASTEQDSASSEDDDSSADDDGEGDDSLGQEKLEKLDEHIRQARSRAEDNVEGVGQEEPSGPTASGGDSGTDDEHSEEFHESGGTESEDDQTIAPPG